MSFRSSKIGDNILPFPGQKDAGCARPTPLLPVLIVLHQETSTPGRVGNALRALGHPLDIRRPRFGDPLPDTLDAACRRGDLRRPDERQRCRRLCPPRDRLDRSSAARAAAVPRHLPRRADACQTTRRAGRAASRRPGPDRLLSDPPDRGGARALPGLAGAGLSLASRRISAARAAPNCWPKATTFRCRRFSTAMRSASSFIPT